MHFTILPTVNDHYLVMLLVVLPLPDGFYLSSIALLDGVLLLINLIFLPVSALVLTVNHFLHLSDVVVFLTLALSLLALGLGQTNLLRLESLCDNLILKAVLPVLNFHYGVITRGVSRR